MSQIDFSGGRRSAAFPLLTDEQLDLFRRFGQERAFEAGEILFRPGDPATTFFIVLEGRIAILDDQGRPDERVIIEHGKRSFLGEFNLLSGQPALFTAIGREPGRVLAVPVRELRMLIASEAALSNIILGALLSRRALLLSEGVGARIIGSRYSPDTRRLLEFAARNRVPHALLDVESDPETEELLRALDVSPDEMPVVLLGDHVFNNPTNPEFAHLLGFVPSPDHRDVYDLLVIGPARPDWPLPSTARRRGSRRCCSRAWRSVTRPERRRGSRTTSASRPASRGPSSPRGPRSRRRSSKRDSRTRARRWRSSRATTSIAYVFQTVTRSSREP